jgi:hypothetical protein
MFYSCRSCKRGFHQALLLLTAVLATMCVLQCAARAEQGAGTFDKGPKTIASKERVSVLIDREARDGKSFIVLKITVPNDSKINAFAIENPARLVLDFEGTTIKKSENFAAPDNKIVKQIRLGAHTGKLRVVIDTIGTKVPEYEWKAGKRQAIVTFVEGAAPSQPPAAAPTSAPAQPTPIPTIATPTSAPVAPTVAATATPIPEESPAQQPTLAELDGKEGAAGQPAQAPAATAALPPADADVLEEDADDESDLGDLEAARTGPPPTRVPTNFIIKGYKFEYGVNKAPVLKIVLNKPNAKAQISKVDSETYKIELKDCGVENDDLELPQFPPHDFVGFVMVVAESVGKNVEVSVSVEEETTLTTSVRDNEVWVTKP